nr:ISL3 family transposase [Bdellovibrio sp. HAGR004]BFD65908.1 ISL3 family transposase [Bdellovibrio sp. HAGR004]BFD66378.1 ISL3 family transposase [Bdellovibrio sp. HAGR004]BFD66562.1 ISL3 family transposase [Bdellovibrio sp. HAGR004]BFD66622.1 ISL3 family transposase [Bdellovibrio sp. HAGR004]
MRNPSDSHQLFEQLLGLVPPWSVTNVNLDTVNRLVEVDVEWSKGHEPECPECGRSCSIKDHREERRWRHLDTMQFQTIIRSRVPRSDCKEHGAKTINVPWAGPNSRFTLLFERLAIDVMIAAKSLKEAARLLGLSWDQVHHIQKRAVERGLERRKLDEIKHVGIDEKSFLKGHKYASLMTDIGGARVLDVVEGRTLEATDSLWQKLPEETRSGIDAVAMDMWDAFITSTKTNAPQADIVHDKFHISKYLGDAVDKVRRQEHRAFMKDDVETLKGAKYLFLKNPENMSDAETSRFNELRMDKLKSGRAWSMKEMFSEFWSYTYQASARKFFDRWYWWATHSRLKPMSDVAKLMRRHLDNILTYLRHHITNAMMEGFNSKIQSIKANARGFRNFANYRIAILFYCGKLELYPA